MQAEVAIGAEYTLELVDLAPCACARYDFVRQTGATCMSTSLANGMIALGEPAFRESAVRRVESFTSHIVANTSSFGKPSEYRSIDDMHKYLRRDEAREASLSGDAKIEHRYRCVLTDSLLDVVTALHSGHGRIVVQQQAHARLAYELLVESGAVLVRQRDPFMGSGSDDHHLIPLAEWRQSYLWSPLKKIPSTMGFGFDRLSQREVREHLARYGEMANLGIECISGILVRCR